MNCRFAETAEYDAWVLGVCEPEDAAEIKAHLAGGCPECARVIRERIWFWYLMGQSLAAQETAVPPARLRRNVLALAARKPLGAWWTVSSFTWPRAAFAAVTILAVGEAGLLVRRSRPKVANQPPGQETTQLSDALRHWRGRAETAEQSLAIRKDVVPAQTSPPVASAAPPNTSDLERRLAAALQQAASVTDALNAERSRIARLESDADSHRVALTALATERAGLERRLADALADRTTPDKDRQIVTLTAQVRRLEQENQIFRQSIATLERQVERSTRLVAMLNSPSIKLVKLQPTEAGGRSSGRAFVVEGQKLVFYASNLPALPPGRAYQLWLLRGRRPAIVSGGLIAAGSLGAPLEFDTGSVMTDLRGLAITEEPAGGSPGPTGHKIMVGTVGSL